MNHFFISQSFDSFESFDSQVRNWDLDFIQLSPGCFFSDLTYFGDNELSVGSIFLGQHFHQRGSAPPDQYTFAIHHQRSQPHRWRYLDCPMNGIVIFPENNELQSVSLSGFHQYTISIEKTLLASVARDIGLPEIHTFIKKGEVTLCDEKYIWIIRQYLESLIDLMKKHSDINFELLMNSGTKWKIARLVLIAIASSTNIKLKNKQIDKNRVVNRVLEYIDSDLTTTRNIPELCRIAEVDERTLRNYFYDLFSTSPQKYIKSYRLNIVKKALIALDSPQVTIADIANINGFWHMGQFAKDYRKLFHELPSDTLGNSTKHSLINRVDNGANHAITR